MAAVTRYESLARAITERIRRCRTGCRASRGSRSTIRTQMALSTVAEIARDAARAAVRGDPLRERARLFDGFLALQRVYRERLVARSATYRERIESLRKRGGDAAARAAAACRQRDRRARAAARARRPAPASRRAADAGPRQRRAFTSWRSAARSRSRRTSPTACRSSRCRAFLLDSVGGHAAPAGVAAARRATC